MLESATAAYKKWEVDNKNKIKFIDDATELDSNIVQVQKANLDQLVEQAIAGIKDL